MKGGIGWKLITLALDRDPWKFYLLAFNLYPLSFFLYSPFKLLNILYKKCIPSPLAPYPIRVQSCVCCLFWANRNNMAIISIFLSQYLIRVMKPSIDAISKWKYLLLLKQRQCVLLVDTSCMCIKGQTKWISTVC